MKPLLHPAAAAALDTVKANPGSAYIFYGSTQVGKRTAAVWLTRALNCRGDQPDPCANCRAIAAGNYPDLITVAPEGQSIGIAQIHQLQEPLSLLRYYSRGQRVVIIDQADKLTEEAQNSLLKLLEEPPAATTLILIVTDRQTLLPTVRSRCQEIFFPVPEPDQLAGYLQSQTDLDSPTAKAVAGLAAGAVGLALQLAGDAEQRQLRQEAADSSQQLLTASRFQRLLAAARLADRPEQAVLVVESLAAHLRTRLRQDSANRYWSTALEAITAFHRRRQANVSLKVALEGLMLEL